MRSLPIFITDGKPQAARQIPADAHSILAYLPDRIRIALITRAAAIEYSIEAVVGRSPVVSTRLALGFADCKLGRGK